MRRLRRALESQEGSHIKAVFWDCPSLPQKPRSGAEEKCFKQALTVMGDLYASALGVTVVRHRFIPARPRSYDGELVLLPPDKWGLAASDDPASAVLAVRDRLKCPPSIHVAVADGGAMKRWALRYPTHDAALAALRTPEAEAVEEAGGALFAAWNSWPYEERGWTTFESAVTTEVVARAAYFPRQHEALSRLPPKLIEIDEAPPRILHNLSEEGGVGEEQGAGPRIERIRARINAARHLEHRGYEECNPHSPQRVV